jgi:hypothetical protein
VAISPFPFITRGILRALPAIERGVRQGIGANELEGILRSAGLGVRRQALQKTMNYLRESIDRVDELLKLPREILPTHDKIPVAITKIRRAYSYRVAVEATDSLTGKREERFVTVATNERISPAQAEREAANLARAEDAGEGSGLARERFFDLKAATVWILRAGPEGTIQ